MPPCDRNHAEIHGHLRTRINCGRNLSSRRFSWKLSNLCNVNCKITVLICHFIRFKTHSFKFGKLLKRVTALHFFNAFNDHATFAVYSTPFINTHLIKCRCHDGDIISFDKAGLKVTHANLSWNLASAGRYIFPVKHQWHMIGLLYFLDGETSSSPLRIAVTYVFIFVLKVQTSDWIFPPGHLIYFWLLFLRCFGFHCNGHANTVNLPCLDAFLPLKTPDALTWTVELFAKRGSFLLVFYTHDMNRYFPPFFFAYMVS